MSIDYTVSLGYGFPIPPEIKWDGVEEIVSSFRGTDFIWHGNAYIGDSQSVVIISETKSMIWVNEDLKPIKLPLSTNEWDEKLKEIAKQLGIDKPKLGWYLCASVS